MFDMTIADRRKPPATPTATLIGDLYERTRRAALAAGHGNGEATRLAAEAARDGRETITSINEIAGYHAGWAIKANIQALVERSFGAAELERGVR